MAMQLLEHRSELGERKRMVPKGAIERCVIDLRSTLRDALLSLEGSSSKVVLVAEGTRRVVGLLTDGDLRRAMLRGATMADLVEPHMKRTFTFVGPRASRADVLDLMQARRIAEVPVLDESGRLVGLHRMHDVLAGADRPNWAVVMAGGKGTRLAPLTDSIPKPMLRVAGRPILERIVLHLAGAGIDRIYLAINYLGHVVEEHFGDGQRFGCDIRYLKEDRALGTAGAIALLPEKSAHSLLVLNGDLVTQTDFGDMLDFHARGGQALTVGVHRYVHTVPFGCFELNGSRIVGVEEKPTFSKVINAGIYVIDPEAVAQVPAATEFTMPELIGETMSRGRTVVAYEIVDDWIDVGQKDQLQKARGDDR